MQMQTHDSTPRAAAVEQRSRALPLKRLALGALFGSMLLMALAYASAFTPGGAPGWAAWLMVLAIASSMVATMMVGAARGERIGRLGIPFLFVFAVLAGGFSLALRLSPTDPFDPQLWLGLPPGAAVVVYGIGLLPLFAVPLAYALTFEGTTLSPGDLERVRAAALALRAKGAGATDAGRDGGHGGER
jgi:hypothetical protein